MDVVTKLHMYIFKTIVEVYEGFLSLKQCWQWCENVHFILISAICKRDILSDVEK